MAGEVWVDVPAATDAAHPVAAVQRHLEATWRKLGPQIAAACKCLDADGSTTNDIRRNLEQGAGPIEQLVTVSAANVGTFATNLAEVVNHLQAPDAAGADSMRRLHDAAGADSMRRA